MPNTEKKITNLIREIPENADFRFRSLKFEYS
jgi:hypothetical protein